jgi:F1F0 ATPase subunit 2
MNEPFFLFAAAFTGGAILGLFFFWGLQWTLQRYLTSPYAGILFAVSMLLRIGLTVAGFYLIGQGDWQRFLFCLIGFVFARTAILRLAGRKSAGVV